MICSMPQKVIPFRRDVPFKGLMLLQTSVNKVLFTERSEYDRSAVTEGSQLFRSLGGGKRRDLSFTALQTSPANRFS
jgi:hypothetical protein